MKTYIVIGASSGIGKEITRQLVAKSHRVIGTYYKDPVESDQPGLEYHYLDVMDEELNLDFLPDSIDGLVYCPGSIKLKPFSRIKPNQFEADFQLQVLGAIKVLQGALPALKANTGGSVVMFSTVAVQSGFNFHSQVATSKGAVEGLIRSLAAEWAPNIRVNGIAPSITNTPLAGSLLSTDQKKQANAEKHPLKRIGTPEDIANMAEFLLSDNSSWITGQIMHVDGGMSSLKV
jgi:NAD(P)-dependent dehydrogenase (short-subunit alcohol dehydrogenase family)